MHIDHNVGHRDKMIRGLMSSFFLVLAIAIHWSYALIAIMLAVTAMTNFCPIYKFIKKDTLRDEDHHQPTH